MAMPESQEKALAEPYHKTAFAYDAQSATFTCPQGTTLYRVGVNAPACEVQLLPNRGVSRRRSDRVPHAAGGDSALPRPPGFHSPSALLW